MFGKRRAALGAADRDRAHRAGAHVRRRRRQAVEHRLDAAAEQVLRRGLRAAIGHVHDVDAAGDLQELARQVMQRADAAGAEVQLARLRLRERDVFLEVRDRQILVDQHHQRQAADDGDVAEILARVVGLVRHQRGVDRLRGDSGGEPRVAVGRRLRDDVRADDPAAARPVLHHERLAELRLQLIGERAGQDVRGARGRRAGNERTGRVGQFACAAAGRTATRQEPPAGSRRVRVMVAWSLNSLTRLATVTGCEKQD